MSQFRFPNKRGRKAGGFTAPVNYEFWDFGVTPVESGKMLKFRSQNGRVVLKMKASYRDLVPDDFMETS